MRIAKLALEENVGGKIDIRSNAWHWLVDCSTDIFNRYKVGVDGATPYKRVKGRESNAPLA